MAEQSRQGKPNGEFFFPSFLDSIRLGLVTTLKSYEDRTQDFWEEETKPFLVTIKLHRAVSSITTARWLKRLLEVAGMDTSIFSAFSSTTSIMVIPTTYILKTAVWSSESLFENVYYKSIQDPAYGRAVLSSQKYSVRFVNTVTNGIWCYTFCVFQWFSLEPPFF